MAKRGRKKGCASWRHLDNPKWIDVARAAKSAKWTPDDLKEAGIVCKKYRDEFVDLPPKEIPPCVKCADLTIIFCCFTDTVCQTFARYEGNGRRV